MLHLAAVQEFGTVSWEKYHARLPAKERKADPVYRIKTGHRDEVFFMPKGRFRDGWDHGYGYTASTKAILGCLLLFAMLTRRVSRWWKAGKTHQREYQKLLPAKDEVGVKKMIVKLIFLLP
ncbi:hypothetical protein GE21DRAFT_6785 [Neurospora crassa]|uniref:Uncharacterized protein n=1 Tax=Neurospora crassa (strain ATCC 24698 / 74-OR23-1A / CBS 708.71 / DSM 1257 / FGSC 987) TaxID=367110 RepID=V5IQS6_NEUCR|nr:hypothetical protein NCU16905 [Neurospora crassa OR74A]ESA43111.1 hypothetical protein NCU16905 [Neurospora crassa OR74A]KHE79060.1 hypothetical protein GE21DRAFT_6785 [Neurospora crassa]|eukprot:XP_011394451.1 hypothetical protein NCU16905 [Neurospora crassa OR74A]